MACLRNLQQSLVEHLPLRGFLALTWTTYLLVRAAYLGPELVVTGSEFFRTLVIAGAAILGVSAGYTTIWALRSIRAGPSEAGGWQDFIGRNISGRQVLGMLVALVWWLLYVRIFDTLKAYIPIVMPFRWDELFMKVERVLHGGVHSWELLHGLLGGPTAIVVVDEIYFSWYFVVVLTIVWAAWTSSRKWRLQFFMALAAVQFGMGNLMALLGSSAGPIYYDRVVTGVAPGSGPCANLVGHLECVHASTSLHMWPIQEGLWSHYQALPDTTTGAIAAMPSIHVAAIVLFAMAAHGTHTVLCGVLWLYALATLVGSVYLGWRYAIDGYVGAIGAVLLWFGAGRFADWYWPRFVRSDEHRPAFVGRGA